MKGNDTGSTTELMSVDMNNGCVSINSSSSSNYKLGVAGSAYVNGTNNKGVFVTDNATYASIVGLNSAISAYNPLEIRASGTDYQLYLKLKFLKFIILCFLNSNYFASSKNHINESKTISTFLSYTNYGYWFYN
jgi:hypothetical protein